MRPTSAVVKYAGQGHDPLAAGRELGVDAILDGSVERADDRIRVTVQLIRVSDGTPSWANQFDEKFINIFALEDSISEQVTRALMLELTVEEKRRLMKRHTESAEAYQAYLKGRYFFNKQLRSYEHPAPDGARSYFFFKVTCTGSPRSSAGTSSSCGR